jgi:hypothetical protein
MNCIINNQEYFETNSALHSVNSRNKYHLHRGIASLPRFQKKTHYNGIKISNNLPSSLKSLINGKTQFEVSLERFLNAYPLYFLDEFPLSKNYSFF